MIKRRTTSVLLAALPVLAYLFVLGQPAAEEATPRGLYLALHLGEAFPADRGDGIVYVEPFSVPLRSRYAESTNYSATPVEVITVFPIERDGRGYPARFVDIVRDVRIDELEPEASYFSQPFSRLRHTALRYATETALTGHQLVLSFPGLEVATVDRSVSGEPRETTPEELTAANEQMLRDREIEEQHRTLAYITLERTIAGASQLAVVSFEGTPLQVRLSRYKTHTFEDFGTVYVMDVLRGASVVETFEKAIWDGPA